MDEEVTDHPNMFVYGSQPLGGWNDNLDVATGNHFSDASMIPRACCARKKLGSGGLPHMTRPSTTPIRHADTNWQLVQQQYLLVKMKANRTLP